MLALASPLSLLVGVGNNQAGIHYNTYSADKASPTPNGSSPGSAGEAAKV